ncbi:uncharacterized protein TNCV_15301 [Trichonephila clavipes]|nr:uncharacterized protein TNCV_15301 [Trichonephila clavipes]
MDFADASTAAYGAVLYAQSISEEDVSTRLLCSKSRVAPVKPITIPRLELCACVLLSQLLEKVLHSLTLPIQQIMLWTDSNIVLAWIQRSPEQLKTFIGNRIKSIQRLIQNGQWKHVSSNDNPADLISRGLNASDISSKQLWWHGPDVLREELEANPIDFERITSDSPQALLYCTRQRFWPLRGRSIARKIVHECVVCFKNKPIVANQLIPSLPPERVNPSFPFLHTGIDYCGPFFISFKGRPSRNCLGFDHSYIATLKRFVARRRKCATISSNNVKNFVGANRELKRFHNLLKFPEEKLSSYLSSEGISWKFMPPRAPNFGGLWEAGVKSFKFYLKRAVGNLKMTLEEFLTIITQIEGILNSRPITPLSEDIDELEVLTPGHFLNGRPITSISEPNLLDKTENTLSRWQKLTKIVQHIWTKWSRDYLNNLQQRNKWQFHKDNVKLNAMVLIKDDNLPVNKWSLGCITKIVPGTDGKVRVVEIKTN